MRATTTPTRRETRMSTWTVLVATHAIAACLTLPLGAVQLWRRPRGDTAHCRLGRVLAGLMVYAAASSFWIRDLRHGSFSLLHVLSVITLVSVALGVIAARRGDIARHRGNMVGAWLGAVGAFIGAVVVPSRLIPRMVVDRPATAAAATVAVLAVAVTVGVASGALGRRTAS
jgi:uncharacterized membrane protein